MVDPQPTSRAKPRLDVIGRFFSTLSLSSLLVSTFTSCLLVANEIPNVCRHVCYATAFGLFMAMRAVGSGAAQWSEPASG